MGDINNSGTQFGSQTAPGQEWITNMIKSGAGVLYSIWSGKIEGFPGGDYGDNYLLPDDGIIPLTAEAERIIKMQTAGPFESGFMPLFGLEGPGIGIKGAFGGLLDRDVFDGETELPPGVIKGLPEGAARAGYVPVGRSVGRGDVGKGQGGLFMNLLPTGEPVVRMHSPDPRNLQTDSRIPREVIIHQPNPNVEEKPDPPITREIVLAEEDVIPEDPIQSEEIINRPALRGYDEESMYNARPMGLEDLYEETVTKPVYGKDPLFGPNLLASIASGLRDVNLSGAAYEVPRYDQGVYASRQLGPAVRNLYRG